MDKDDLEALIAQARVSLIKKNFFLSLVLRKLQISSMLHWEDSMLEVSARVGSSEFGQETESR